MTDNKTISEVLGKIHKLYGKAEFLKNIEGGFLSQNFVLKNNGSKLFLKQYRFDSLNKIKEIQQVKFFFASKDIPIILPIRNNSGKYIFKHKEKFYSIFPFVDGRIIRHVHYTFLSLFFKALTGYYHMKQRKVLLVS